MPPHHQQQPFRWQTVLELSLISPVIYLILGAPGFPTALLPTFTSTSTSPDNTENESPIPVARTSLDTLVSPSPDLVCPPHNYTVHIFATSPLVIYIDNFVSDSEAAHLTELSQNSWQASTIFTSTTESTNPSVRKSDKALLPRDPTVQCLEARALGFQGWPRETFIEQLWTQRYNVSGHYAHHYDWATSSKSARRVSSFMVYLGDECEGGGTNFPRLDVPAGGGGWCEFIECGDAGGGSNGVLTEGVTFKPRKGAAVFWMNFDESGRGYRETIHAGLPVTKGVKVGLNIWSWFQAGHVID
ncbi:hypothetical protein LTR08_004324 [Meristemomyces frigidus]|nr:hypothetical protein LTR08_004324 [Meristemomyces frigidus]